MTSAAETFVSRGLWRPVEGTTACERMVALVGPHGSGKSKTLDEIARICGDSIVHVKIDFAELQVTDSETDKKVADPIAAVAYVAFMLSRAWPNLPHTPTFHRVGLSLMALNETKPLPPTREQAETEIRGLLRRYLRRRDRDREARAANVMSYAVRFALALTSTWTGIKAPDLNPDAVTAGVTTLLRFTRRRRSNVRRALRWFKTLPEGTNTVDSLMNLSRNRGSSDALDHLVRALLADLADNGRRWSTPIRKCKCKPQERWDQPHEHAWVLLVDNVGPYGGAGWKFLNALAQARQDSGYKRDPLLVVAAVGRWEAPLPWGDRWRAPWLTETEDPTGQRLPLLSEVDFDRWNTNHGASDEQPADSTTRAWYPVWLDRPGDGEIADLAQVTPRGWKNEEFHTLVRQLSGGLPHAVTDIGNRIDKQHGEALPNSPSLLLKTETVPALWKQALESDRIPRALREPSLLQAIPQAVAVAVHLRQPGRLAGGGLGPPLFPAAATILRELRENLWVSTFAARPSRLWPVVADPDQEHPAAMHPWLVSCLLAGLHEESDAGHLNLNDYLSWAELFSRLSDEFGSAGGNNLDAPARRLYYDLACGRFDTVVDMLAETFPPGGYRDWVWLLDQVTAAPCRRATTEPTEKIVKELAPEPQPGRDPIRVWVSKLVVLLWLYRDPHTIQTTDWDETIRERFEWLAGQAQTDRNALVKAAKQFSHE